MVERKHQFPESDPTPVEGHAGKPKEETPKSPPQTPSTVLPSAASPEAGVVSPPPAKKPFLTKKSTKEKHIVQVYDYSDDKTQYLPFQAECKCGFAAKKATKEEIEAQVGAHLSSHEGE